MDNGESARRVAYRVQNDPQLLHRILVGLLVEGGQSDLCPAGLCLRRRWGFVWSGFGDDATKFPVGF